MRQAKRASPDRTERRLQAIQRRIAALQYVCTGTISHQTRRCGKPTCACANDPDARHGPYYVWSRRQDNRQINSMLPNEAGPLFEQAVDNYQKLRDLLHEWERATADLLLAKTTSKSRRGQDISVRPNRRSQPARRRPRGDVR